MERALLSIVLIARRNTSSTLKRALNSALAQTWEPKEIFVVDANAWDSAESMSLQEDLMDYPSVTYLQPPRIKTGAKPRNHALSEIHGDFVVYMSGSEEWKPRKSALQIDQLINVPETGASCCDGTLFCEGGGQLAVDTCLARFSYHTVDWLRDNPIKASGQIMYRTAALQAIGGFDTRMDMLADMDALVRLKESFVISTLPINLFRCTVRNDRETAAQLYQEEKRLLDHQRYTDLLVCDREAFYRFNVERVRLARQAGLYFDTFLTAMYTFVRSPLRTLRNLLAAMVNGAVDGVKHAGFEYRMLLWRIRLKPYLRNGKIEEWADAVEHHRPCGATKAEVFAGQSVQSILPPFVYAGNAVQGHVDVPKYVTVISRGAFMGCTDMTSITIPDSVVRIEDGAFMGCTKLRSVSFGANGTLREIGAYAFAGCQALQTILLPVCVRKIGRAAFACCVELRTIDFYRLNDDSVSPKHGFFAQSVQVLSPFVFAQCRRLEEIRFMRGSTLRIIGSSAFMNCESLHTVWLDTPVSEIGDSAFMHCQNLRDLVFMDLDLLKRIGKQAFMFCSALQQFTLPPFLPQVESGTFHGCDGLHFLHIPSSVKLVCRRAFTQCDNLTKVVIDSDYTDLQKGAFDPRTQLIRAVDDEPIYTGENG